MYGKFQDFLKAEIQSIKDAGLYKTERLIATPQDAEIKLTTGETVLNFCANNYLGLSSHPRVIEGAKKALDARGYGMSSVRFICGTQDIHNATAKARAAGERQSRTARPTDGRCG